MSTYYDPQDLKKFGEITEWDKELGEKFLEYYGKVFEGGALTAREKSLIAVAVSHAVHCTSCNDGSTEDGVKRGCSDGAMRKRGPAPE